MNVESLKIFRNLTNLGFFLITKFSHPQDVVILFIDTKFFSFSFIMNFKNEDTEAFYEFKNKSEKFKKLSSYRTFLLAQEIVAEKIKELEQSDKPVNLADYLDIFFYLIEHTFTHGNSIQKLTFYAIYQDKIIFSIEYPAGKNKKEVKISFDDEVKNDIERYKNIIRKAMKSIFGNKLKEYLETNQENLEA